MSHINIITDSNELTWQLCKVNQLTSLQDLYFGLVTHVRRTQWLKTLAAPITGLIDEKHHTALVRLEAREEDVTYHGVLPVPDNGVRLSTTSMNGLLATVATQVLDWLMRMTTASLEGRA